MPRKQGRKSSAVSSTGWSKLATVLAAVADDDVPRLTVPSRGNSSHTDRDITGRDIGDVENVKPGGMGQRAPLHARPRIVAIARS